MRYLTVFISVLFFTARGQAQNEFANQAFYTAFKKIKEDGNNGFAEYKGDKIWSVQNLFDTHLSNINLPGADSGRIIIPILAGSPAAHFYFKHQLTKEAAQKKENDLLVAVKSAWMSNPVEKKVTDTIGKFIFYRTRLYKEVPAYSFTNPDVETYVVKENNKYVLVLQIHGVNPPPKATGKSKLTPETDLNARILELLRSMDNGFADENARLKNTTQYYTEYESRYRLYGNTANVKHRTFESSFAWSLNSSQLDGPAEAKELFEKLKAVFSATGRFTFKPETKEGSRTWVYASQAGQSAVYSKFSMVIEYYDDPYSFSVSFLLTKKK